MREDKLHKLSTKMVRENPEGSFVFEDFKGIRRTSEGARRSRRFRTYLTGGHIAFTSRWWSTSRRNAPYT